MKQAKGFSVIEIIVVIALLVMVGGGVYVWQQSQVNKDSKIEVSANPTPTASPTPESNPYAEWKSYTHPNNYYSFKYPADWTVTREVIQEDADYVKLAANGTEVAQIARYFDGTGCPDTPEKTHPMTIGSVATTATSFCNSTFYGKMTKITTTVQSTGKMANQARVDAAFGIGHDANLDLFTKSITGLAPID